MTSPVSKARQALTSSKTIDYDENIDNIYRRHSDDNPKSKYIYITL
jgi:hypothetical protein